MKSTSHGIVELAHQVREEEHRALQHADQQQVLARVVAGDLRRQLAHPARRGPRRGRGSRRSRRRRLTAIQFSRGFAPVGRGGTARRALGVRPNRSTPSRDARPDAVREVERRRPCSPSAAISSARRAAPGAGRPAALVGQPLHDQPAQRRRQRAQPRELDLRAARPGPRRRARRAPPPRRAGSRRAPARCACGRRVDRLAAPAPAVRGSGRARRRRSRWSRRRASARPRARQ